MALNRRIVLDNAEINSLPDDPVAKTRSFGSATSAYPLIVNLASYASYPFIPLPPPEESFEEKLAKGQRSLDPAAMQFLDFSDSVEDTWNKEKP